MNRNYQKELEMIIDQHKIKNQVPSLLLHSCCAPCSSYVLEYLSQYFAITVLYYNPNIHPDTEYEKRRDEQQTLIRRMSALHPIQFISGVFDQQRFYQLVKGYETCGEGQQRCGICYRMRLEEAARLAKEKQMDYFCSTLSISPLKNAEQLNHIGTALAAEYGVPWLVSDFKKKNGYGRSVELSKAFGLYRQNYCGCIFSQINR